MLAKVYSFGINGLDAYPVTIEVDVSSGLPNVTIVGLPDNAIKESKERIKSAIRNSGFDFPVKRVTINLSPADIKKEGPSFDLPMALGILAATGQIALEPLPHYIFLGELSLDGHLRPVNGALSISLAMKHYQYKGLALPQLNVNEAALCQTTNVFAVNTLMEAVNFCQAPEEFTAIKINPTDNLQQDKKLPFDFAEVKGQYLVKRGLEIAAAGGHNVLMIGPPGAGKSMLAKRFSSILPDLSLEEALEVTQIHSVIGTLEKGRGLVSSRPFRSPHHTTSDVALVGGGSQPRPGEVTLSHHGVLFLDELPEFHRHALESLRQPLEDQYVTISRASKTVRFPSKFQLIAAMNPSPSGQFISSAQNTWSTTQMQKYLSRISGPLLDRIDIHLEVNPVATSELMHDVLAESSNEIKKRTLSAREKQLERFTGKNIFTNAQMDHKSIKKFCSLDADGKMLLKAAMDELKLSARGYDKILKLSRTIADLAGEEKILAEHIAEAVQFRTLDRKWWG